MGIRYYAYPLAPKFVKFALEDPEPFLSDDPFADAWFLDDDERPEMLYLDKSWPSLQALTNPPGGTPRSAYQLFEGQVTYIDNGCQWYAWTKALAPEAVDSVARDLALLGTEDVETVLNRYGSQEAERANQRSYILHHLRKAQEFTSRVQEWGWGIIYSIG